MASANVQSRTISHECDMGTVVYPERLILLFGASLSENTAIAVNAIEDCAKMSGRSEPSPTGYFLFNPLRGMPPPEPSCNRNFLVLHPKVLFADKIQVNSHLSIRHGNW